jgi:hypothetical protein
MRESKVSISIVRLESLTYGSTSPGSVGVAPACEAK